MCVNILRWLSKETDAPQSSIHSHKTAFLQPHKFRVAKKPQEAECVMKVRFWNWFNAAVCNGEVSPLLTGFTDKKTYTVTKYSN
jgi:hypothetical protein